MACDEPLDSHEEPVATGEAVAAPTAHSNPAVVIRPWGPWASLGWTLLMIFALVGVQIAVAVAFVAVRMAAGARTDLQELSTNGNLLAFSALASTPVALALSWALIYFRGCSAAKYLSLSRPSLRQAGTSAAGLVLVVAATDLTTWLLSRSIVSQAMVDAYRTASLPLLLLALLLAAPLAEETLFRGFLFRGIAQSRWGPGWAIALSSVSWASLHVQYDLYTIGTIVLMGVYLGWVRYRSDSLLLTMLLHAIANTIATIELTLH